MAKRKERDLYLMPDEWRKLVYAAYEFSKKIGLFFDMIGQSGFRISEALSVRVKDFDFEKNIIYILTLKKKNHPIEEIQMPKDFMSKINEYIKQIGLRSNDQIFTFTRQYGWKIFKRLCINAKLSSGYSPHGLRHCHGIMVAEITNGNTIKIIKRLRQTSDAMALKYTHLTSKINQEVVDGMDQFMKGDINEPKK